MSIFKNMAKEIIIPSNNIFKIHFICTGNTFRSRLASTYLASQEIPRLKVSSSGTEAQKNLNGPITWYGQKLIKENHLIKYQENNWKRTNKKILNDADYIIFIQKQHLLDCQEKYAYNLSKHEVWDIRDISTRRQTDLEVIEESREIFNEIKIEVDNLTQRIKFD